MSFKYLHSLSPASKYEQLILFCSFFQCAQDIFEFNFKFNLKFNLKMEENLIYL